MLALCNRLESGLKTILPHAVISAKRLDVWPKSNAFLPLGEGLQLRYVERTVSPPKWLHWRTYLRPFEWFKRPTWGDRQRTNPSQNIAITD
jgi:hypothetical protein